MKGSASFNSRSLFLTSQNNFICHSFWHWYSLFCIIMIHLVHFQLYLHNILQIGLLLIKKNPKLHLVTPLSKVPLLTHWYSQSSFRAKLFSLTLFTPSWTHRSHTDLFKAWSVSQYFPSLKPHKCTWNKIQTPHHSAQKGLANWDLLPKSSLPSVFVQPVSWVVFTLKKENQTIW